MPPSDMRLASNDVGKDEYKFYLVDCITSRYCLRWLVERLMHACNAKRRQVMMEVEKEEPHSPLLAKRTIPELFERMLNLDSNAGV